MARVLAVVADLMLASRVEGSLTAAGHAVIVAPSLPAEADADLLVSDLDAVDPAAVAAIGIPALGFYSHIDVGCPQAGRGGGDRPGRAALADGAGDARAGRAPAGSGRLSAERSGDVERALEDPVAPGPHGPRAQVRLDRSARPGRERDGAPGAGRADRRGRARDGGEQVGQGRQRGERGRIGSPGRSPRRRCGPARAARGASHRRCTGRAPGSGGRRSPPP